VKKTMPKTILLLASNPKDTTRLRLDEEVREIYNGLRGAKRRDDFVLQQVWAVRSEDVRRAMLDYEPQIVHFSGHGEGENGIAFEDNDGNTQLVSTEALADFFKAFSNSVECVVLNACYSEVQALAIAEHIDFVIGMNQPIGDKAAIEFAVAFYDAVGAGKDIPFAFDLACNAIQWANIPEHLTPVLKNTRPHEKLKSRQRPDSTTLLQTFGNRISRDCVFITPDLIQKNDEPTHNIIVGKTINLKQIVDNSFMERQGSIDDAVQYLDQHVQDNLSSGNSQLVTFWIDGKSGSGKSVLLLQILQKLVLERNAKVFWLANDFGLLEKILIEWVDTQLTFDEPIYIFIDDFNSPQNRDTLDYQSIVQILSDIRSQDIRWPVIVTCSPPEYLEEFKASGRDEGFLVQRWMIPLMNRSEQTALLEWFKQRTGKSHKTGLAFTQEEGLIVSMMFELQYGNMKEFGKRFKARLDSSGLTEIMAQPLALNRLYIWPPEQWFNEISIEQKEALAILNAGNDFLFTSTDGQGDGYVRLTHPHLSDIIYKSIRPQSGGIVRADDLANAFERAFKFSDVLATKILLAVSMGGERLEDLDNQYLARRMAEIWLQYESYVWKNHAIGVAFVWTDWVRWAARDPKVKSLFKSIAPIEKAIDSIGYSHSHWGNIWLQLWESEPNYGRLVEYALVWLERSERYHYSEPSWYEVWFALLSSPKIKGQINIFSELLALGLKKLDDSRDYRWADIWLVLIENMEGIPASEAQELVALGIEWLAVRENLRQWSLVWQALLKQEQYFPASTTITDILDLGIHWLNGREHRVQWSFVWEELIRKKNSKKLPRGITTFDLLSIGINWLAQSNQDQVQWPFVWEGVVEYWEIIDLVTRNQILEKGLNWLKNHESSNSWPYMFEKYLPKLEDGERRNLLIDLAKNSLLKAEVDSKEWHPVWDACMNNWKYLDTEFRDQILNQSLNWLKNQEGSSNWPYIFEKCLPKLEDGERRNLLIDLAKDSLFKAEVDSKEWHLAWDACINNWKYLDTEFRDQVLNLGLNWLENHNENPRWLSIFTKYISKIKNKNQKKLIIDSSRPILSKTDIKSNEWYLAWDFWMNNWKFLDEEFQGQILNQGYYWLKNHNKNPKWLSIFIKYSSKIKNNKQENHLLDLEKPLISNIGVNGEKWLLFWGACVKIWGNLDEEFQDVILDHVINWIEANQDPSQSLSLALSLLSNDKECLSEKAKNRLDSLVKKRLYENDIKNPEWHFVWSIFVKYGENLNLDFQAEIARQGFDWLKTQDDVDSFLSVFEECSSLVVDGVEYLDLFINWVTTKIKFH
jgi:hypothetical protein